MAMFQTFIRNKIFLGKRGKAWCKQKHLSRDMRKNLCCNPKLHPGYISLRKVLFKALKYLTTIKNSNFLSGIGGYTLQDLLAHSC